MKIKILKRINTILTALLAFLGLNCNCVGMYGVPSATLQMSGDVSNTQGEPLKEILIFATETDAEGNFTSPTEYISMEIDHWNNGNDSTKEAMRRYIPMTDANGHYSSNREIFPTHHLAMIAIDPTGEYENDTVFLHDLEIKKNARSGTWYQGDIFVEQDFELRSVSAESSPLDTGAKHAGR